MQSIRKWRDAKKFQRGFIFQGFVDGRISLRIKKKNLSIKFAKLFRFSNLLQYCSLILAKDKRIGKK